MRAHERLLGALLVLLVVLTLGATLSGAPPGWAQTQRDPTKLLIGHWDGEAQTPTGVYDRTLIIKSVEVRNGQLMAIGEYGGPGASRMGSKPLPVQGIVEEINGEIVLRIFTPERRTAVLTLQQDGKRLLGGMGGGDIVGMSRQGDDSLRFRKVE
jgi:hypothetical protein